MLAFLILAIFVAAPLVASELASSVWFDVAFALLLFSGITTVIGRRELTALALVLVLAAVGLRLASLAFPSRAILVSRELVSMASLALFVALILVQVFRSGPVTSHRIQGAIAVYLLLGLIFMLGYDLIYQTVPGSFRFANGADEATHHRHDLAYYSFVTLTTIGYGDIVPAHPAARSLAMAEGLVGQLYPAILIARLVSMQIESRRKS
jgi:ion channel